MRFEEIHASVSYVHDWAVGQTSRAFSGGTAAFSVVPHAQATIAFSGTSIAWIGFRGPQAGIARVLLDGSQVAEVDLFAAFEEVQAEVFRATDLAPGNHTLTVEVTCTMNPAATSAWIAVDAFDITLNDDERSRTPHETSGALTRRCA